MESVKENGRAAWGIRNWIQLAVFMLTICVGIQFFIHVLQASGDGAVTVRRPPGVEGFLPIGALMGWKLFAMTGAWDWVHPAAMVILGYAALTSLVLRKSFCGWFCPIGALSEWLWKLGKRLFGRNYDLPLWLDYPLRGLKYLLLGFFAYIIFTMSLPAIFAFLESPYYKLSDVKMLHFFTRMTPLTAIVLAVLVLFSLPLKNFWCRYLCPYGALMGLLALIGPTRIQRNAETCIGCGRCSKVCPHRLPVDEKERIISPECSGCMDCTLVCPREKTLELKTVGFSRKAWSAAGLGAVVVLLFIGLTYTAEITGQWKSRVPEREFRALLLRVDSPEITHPSVAPDDS